MYQLRFVIILSDGGQQPESDRPSAEQKKTADPQHIRNALNANDNTLLGRCNLMATSVTIDSHATSEKS